MVAENYRAASLGWSFVPGQVCSNFLAREAERKLVH
jgi:hypothetical protein